MCFLSVYIWVQLKGFPECFFQNNDENERIHVIFGICSGIDDEDTGVKNMDCVVLSGYRVRECIVNMCGCQEICKTQFVPIDTFMSWKLTK